MRSRRLRRRAPQHPITRKLRGQAARAHVGLPHPEGTAVYDIRSRLGSCAGACAERPRALGGGLGGSSNFDGISLKFSRWFKESDRQFPGKETRFWLWKYGFGDSASARGIRSLKLETTRAAGEPPPRAGRETLPGVGNQGPASRAPLKVRQRLASGRPVGRDTQSFVSRPWFSGTSLAHGNHWTRYFPFRLETLILFFVYLGRR